MTETRETDRIEKDQFNRHKGEHRPGLYIHVPFCIRKCLYCGFYSVSISPSLVSAWTYAIKKEASHYRDLFPSFDTMYVGGGTPSSLPAEILSGLTKWILDHLSFTGDRELSIEANPGDLDLKKTKAIKNAGYNRINVGIQSFRDRELEILGRRHRARDAMLALEHVKGTGFDSIGIDLMYGLPGQTVAQWLETLELAMEFEPDHISCYELTFEKSTPFWEMKKRKEIIPPGEDIGEEFFLHTSTFLRGQGYIHYEISNFARDENHISRHNIKYWQHIPYLGLGPSAHSFQDRQRWWNVRDISSYCKKIEEGVMPVEDHESLSEEQLTMEYIFLGLRTSRGIDLERIKTIPGAEKSINRLEHEGYLKIEKGRAIPLTKGFLVADALPSIILEKAWQKGENDEYR